MDGSANSKFSSRYQSPGGVTTFDFWELVTETLKFSSRYQSPGGVTQLSFDTVESARVFIPLSKSGRCNFTLPKGKVSNRVVFIPLSKSGRCNRKLRLFYWFWSLFSSRYQSPGGVTVTGAVADMQRMFSSRYQSPGGVTKQFYSNAVGGTVFIPLSKSGRCNFLCCILGQRKCSFHPVIKVRAV